MFKKLRRVLALVVLISVGMTQTPYIAEAAKTTQEKIDEAEKEKEKLEEELEAADDKRDDLNNKQNALQKELKGLNSDLETISEHLEELESRIAAKNDEITKTQAELEEARTKETTQYEAMMKRIKFMYEESEDLYLEILFKAKSFAEMLTLSNYVDAIASYDKKKFEEYQQIRIEVEDLEAKLQSEKVDLEVLKREAEEEKANVLVVINDTSNKVKKYDALIDDAEAEYLKKEKELEEQNATLEKLQKQLEEEKRLSALSANSVWRDISEVTFDEGDRYLLANLIYCEAGGEPYEGQVAVGAVVINRVLSPVYPSTVSGVIYQKSQFSPVGSGRLAYALSVDKATASCYKAADVAMSGGTNVGNCVYFRTPIPGLTGIQIGNHIFY